MAPRKELAATVVVASVGVAVEAVGLVTGHGVGALAPTAALALCVALPAAGLVRASRRRSLARRDPVTGLPGADHLRDELAAFLEHRLDGERRTLLILDLAGFKKYNESFGFAAGDALLRRLAARLRVAVGDRGQAFRLRGADFGVLAAGTATGSLRAAATAALCEAGEGFAIRCVHGAVVVPDDAADASKALKLADQEIQAERATLRSLGIHEPIQAASDSVDAATAASPYDVAEMATAVGHSLGMTGSELDDLERAAALRDVGMMALPEVLLGAPGALSEEEWRFVELHPLVGERLLRANLGLDGVADVVRSSHERWDGLGYPEGLAGEDIPLAARIAFVCSAFQDMTTPRPHRAALTPQDAIRELQRGAGTQFDPAVVSAFLMAFADGVGAAGDGQVGSPAL